jgi:hypothetical protein
LYEMQEYGVRIFTLLLIYPLTSRYSETETTALNEITRGIGQPESRVPMQTQDFHPIE